MVYVFNGIRAKIGIIYEIRKEKSITIAQACL